jgi:hypothetical protein
LLSQSSANSKTVALYTADWISAQEHDPDIAPIYQAKETASNRPAWKEIKRLSPATKNLWSQWDQIKMVNNLLYRIWPQPKHQVYTLQLIVPHHLQTKFISQCHEGLIGGHLGLKKTLCQMQRRAYFHGWRNATKRICRQSHGTRNLSLSLDDASERFS